MVKAQILTCYKDAFNAFIAKLNVKATKLVCPLVNIQYGKTFVDKDNNEISHEYIEVLIDEVSIKLNGWSIIGKVEYNEGSIITSGTGDMKAYRNIQLTQCDHCNHIRDRKIVFIVQHETTNETKQIGSTCLNDFMGHKSALQYAAMFSWIGDIDELIEEQGWDMQSAHSTVVPVKAVLEKASAIIRTCGFVSRVRADEHGSMATVDIIKSEMTGSPDQTAVIEEDEKKAAAALAWFESTQHEDSDFMFNLTQLVKGEYIKPKFIGILASLIPMYNRSLMELLPQLESNHIGAVGDKKVHMKGVIKSITAIDSYYGVTNLYFIITEEGNRIKYFTGTDFGKENEEVEFLATIKGHDEYKGIKQTTITRAKRV